MPTFYAMTVDTEEEWDWSAGWPTSDLKVTNIRQLPKFQELCTRHGVRTTYFTNQAVLDDAEASGTIHDLSKRDNVEIGMHIHPWNTPPLVGTDPVRARQTFLRNLPEDLVFAKLDSVWKAFERHGLRPTSFRGGRYSSGGPIHQFLRDHGFKADSSVVPFATWADDGSPDYLERDLLPVRLQPRFDGDPPLWEVPLTIAYTRRPFGFWARCYEIAQNPLLRRLHMIGIAERLGLVHRIWLNFEDWAGRRMLELLRFLRPMELPCICFTVHSSSLVAGEGPYTQNLADEERIFAQMDEVFGTVATWPDFRPATVTEIADQLEVDYHARTGD
jgi:hypothetical protein